MNYIIFFISISSCILRNALKSDAQYCVTGEVKLYTQPYAAAQRSPIRFTGLSAYSTNYSFIILLELFSKSHSE